MPTPLINWDILEHLNRALFQQDEETKLLTRKSNI